MDVDLNGWAQGPLSPLPVARAYALLAPDPAARMDVARWAHQARTFFAARLELCQQKAYPEGRTPEADAVEIEIGRGRQGRVTRVLVVTVPLAQAPEVRAAADAGVRAIGGAGFDALVARAQRSWQVSDEVAPGGDPEAPLLVAAVLSSVLLAPIVPPGGGTIFGVKGARLRLGV